MSVVINVVKEELEYLPTALKSVKGWADEIVVIDMECEEEVKQMAKRFGARVVSRKREPCVEIARNFGIAQAKGEWVLILDPDEEVGEALKDKLKNIALGDPSTSSAKKDNETPPNLPFSKGEESPLFDKEGVRGSSTITFVRIPRKNIIFGKWMQHSRWWPDYNIRFFKRGYVEWDEKIHSIPLTKGRGIDLPAEENLALIHHHYQTISQFIQRLDRYTYQQLHILQNHKYQFQWSDLITKPANEFLSRYFSGEGYQDGIHGLALALLQSTSELILYLKAWEADKFSQQQIKPVQLETVFRKSFKDSAWWIADLFQRQANYQKYLFWKIKQKLL